MYKLYNENTLNQNTLSLSSIDLTITSPPYNIGIEYNKYKDTSGYLEYLEFSKQWLENVFRWTKINGRLCLNIPLDKNKGGMQSIGADLTSVAKSIGWEYQTTIIWNEQNISKRMA